MLRGLLSGHTHGYALRAGTDAAACDKRPETKDSKHGGCPRKDDLPQPTQQQALAAGLGVLHSLSVLRMLAAGGAATNWRVTTTRGLHLHHVPAHVRIPFLLRGLSRSTA